MSDTDEAEALQEKADEAYENDLDYQSALESYLELLDHPGLYDNNVSKVQWRIAMCYVKLNQADLALQYFQEGHFDEREYEEWFPPATADTDDGDADGDGDGDGSGEDGSAADQPAPQRQSGRGSDDRAFDKAVALYGQGDYRGAADAFVALAKKKDLDADHLKDLKWNLGMSLFKADDKDAAVAAWKDGGFSEEEYTKAMKDEEEAAAQLVPTAEEEMTFTLAYDAYNLQNYAYAAQLYEQLATFESMKPRLKDIYWNLGMCRFNLNDDAAGRAAMDKGEFDFSAYADYYESVVKARPPAPAPVSAPTAPPATN